MMLLKSDQNLHAPFTQDAPLMIEDMHEERLNAVEALGSSFVDLLYELVDVDWDGLGFALTPTDYMYIMKCSQGQSFTKGELQRFGNIELSPSDGVLNYGQVFFH
ncbi:hypothetical protein CsSME_00042983 [Camellia sinensis var. sinensis]